MGITIRDADGVVPTGEVGDIGHTAGASLLTSGGQNAASLVFAGGVCDPSPVTLERLESGYILHAFRLGLFPRLWRRGCASVLYTRTLCSRGTVRLKWRGGGGEGDKGELLVEWPSSGGHRNEAGLVCTERWPGSLEGFGASSCMEGVGWGQTMSVESQGSSESALRLRGEGMEGDGLVRNVVHGGEEGQGREGPLREGI